MLTYIYYTHTSTVVQFSPFLQNCKLNFVLVQTIHRNINGNNLLALSLLSTSFYREGDIYDDVDYTGGELSLDSHAL